MVAKMVCCVVSIASLIMCLLPYRWNDRIYGVPMRYLVASAASAPMVQHLHEFVFDDAFLRTVCHVSPWRTLTLLAFLCHPGSSVARHVLGASTLVFARADVRHAVPLAVGLVSCLDPAGTAIAAAWVVDRLMARFLIPLTRMCARQLFEFGMFFAIVASRDGA